MIILERKEYKLKTEVPENTKQQTFTLHIIDAVGKTMYRQKLNATFENIDLSPFAKGLYMVQIETESAVIRKKICFCHQE